MNNYEVVIGLEIHAAVKTNSKVFSPSKNSFSDIPNENINEIDLSFPGILPSLNKEAVRKALKMSMILGCTQPDELLFDRKNYYYPDLPKGYQITQVTKPVGINGKVELFADNHRSYEKTFSHRIVDTYSILRFMRDAKKIELESLTSAKAFSYFGIKVEGRHSALGDAEATMRLYEKLLGVM